VDKKRVAVVADGAGSSFVSRGVATDTRFAAAVCDGGIWDLHERAFLRRQVTGDEHVHWLDEPNAILRAIECPLLITAGESGWLEADALAEFGRRLSKQHRDATFRLFTRAETAAAQAHSDNPTLANEMIFDWLADRLGLRGSLRYKPRIQRLSGRRRTSLTAERVDQRVGRTLPAPHLEAPR